MKLPASSQIGPPPRVPRAARPAEETGQRIVLPAAAPAPDVTLAACLERRRSTRDYSGEPLSLGQVSQLLWAAQGVTAPGGLRTAPSAGAIYPIRCYFFAARVDGLPAGFYSFDPESRALALLSRGDRQKRLAKACADQVCVEDCACALLLTAWYPRMRREFGDAAARLCAIEAGHIGQNWHLQATALGLGSISIGKIDAAALKLLLPIPQDEDPLYLLLGGRV
jgi:SagB-type dehydrogenase family enzyme